jgi:hypothetical protein
LTGLASSKSDSSDNIDRQIFETKKMIVYGNIFTALFLLFSFYSLTPGQNMYGHLIEAEKVMPASWLRSLHVKGPQKIYETKTRGFSFRNSRRGLQTAREGERSIRLDRKRD